MSETEHDPWFLSEGRIDNRTALVRGREFLADAEPASHPHLLIASWSYQGDPLHGMPGNHESDRMEAFENAVVAAFEPDAVCILFAVTTCAGVREWRFYCRDVGLAQEALNDALAGFPALLPIDLRAQEDPGWDHYSRLLQDCSRTHDATRT